MLVLSTGLKASPSHGTSGSSSQRNPSWSKKKLNTAEKQATIRDLLMSRSGVYHEAAGEHQEMIDARPERGSHAPETYFYCNNWDFNALHATVALSGRFLRKRHANPSASLWEKAGNFLCYSKYKKGDKHRENE
jgi:hypothetical protein